MSTQYHPALYKNSLILIVVALIVILGLFTAPVYVADSQFVRDYICVPSEGGLVECCAYIEGILWCTTCDDTSPPSNCGPRYPNPVGIAPPPTTPNPTAPENALPQGDVQQLPPTPPPTRGEGLFGSEVSPTPPAGLAPPTEPSAPISEPTVPPETGQGEEPTVPPETGQGEDDGTGGGGGIKPPVKDLLPETGIEEQPEVQQPEQEQPSGQGQGPAGPLT
jgi:hypothetical protein